MVHIGTINGKLNGTMLATTPRGTRRSWHVTVDETRSVLPAASWGRLQAYSTVSFPLAMSARAGCLGFVSCVLRSIDFGWRRLIFCE